MLRMTWLWTSLLCLRFPMQMYWTFCARGNFKARRSTPMYVSMGMTSACCFDQPLSTTFQPQRPPIGSMERISLSLYMLFKKTLSRHNPISWDLQSVLLDASVLQLQLSSTQLSLVCLHAGSRTTCRSRLLSRFHLPPSL